jgi:hypothetical protein
LFGFASMKKGVGHMVDQGHLKKLNEGVNVWNKWRKEHPEILPDLRNASLHGKSFAEIDFRHTNLDNVDLSYANLCSASLKSASLCQTNLSGAKLRNAFLYRTCFKETILQHTDFHKASLLETAFLNVDLKETINLGFTVHLGPSTIGIDTIQRSRGKIPDTFLIGAGVAKQLLASFHSLDRAPFDYYSCFISYSSQDQHFVEILYRDLRKAGVLCWFASEDLKAGDKFPAEITEAVQSREKLLIVLSKSSLKSDWVSKEVNLALQKEGNGKSKVLLPIHLDGAYLKSSIDWAEAIRKRRNIRSFENWQQPSRYQKVLEGLLNDLRKE